MSAPGRFLPATADYSRSVSASHEGQTDAELTLSINIVSPVVWAWRRDKGEQEK